MVVETSFTSSASSGSALGFETPPSSITSDASFVAHTDVKPADAVAATSTTSGVRTPTGQPRSEAVDSKPPTETPQGSPKGRGLPLDKVQRDKIKMMMDKGRVRNRALTTTKQPAQKTQTWARPSNGLIEKLMQGKRPGQPEGTHSKAPIHIEIPDDPEEEEDDDDDDEYDTASEGLPAIDVKKSIAAGNDVLEAKVKVLKERHPGSKNSSGAANTTSTEPSAFSRAMAVLGFPEPLGRPQHGGDPAAEKPESKFVPLKRPSTKATCEVHIGARAAARDVDVATRGPVLVTTIIDGIVPKADMAPTSAQLNPSEVGFDTELQDHASEKHEAIRRKKEHEAELAARTAAEKAEAARRAKPEENRNMQGTLKAQIQQALKRAEEKRQQEEAKREADEEKQRADEERRKREEARKKADDEEKRIKREAEEAARKRAEDERAAAEREKRKEAEAAAKNSELAAKLRLIAQRNAERRAAEAIKIDANKPECLYALADKQNTDSNTVSTQSPITAGAQAAAGAVSPPFSLHAKCDSRAPSSLPDFRKKAPAVERALDSGPSQSVTISSEIREPPTAAQLRRKASRIRSPQQDAEG